MKPFKKTLELTKDDYVKAHVNLVNSIAMLGLTTREIEVLSAFAALSGELKEDRFSTLGRKKVKAKLALSDAGLSNFIGFLKEKDCLIDNNDKIDVHPMLVPQSKETLYQFKLICKDEL